MDRADEYERLKDEDHRHIWHPFTQMRDWVNEEPLIINEGRGCFLKDLRGRWYIDGVSSLWVNLHGHRHPELDQALTEQLRLIAHSTMLGASNPPAIMLARELTALLAASMDSPPQRVFYSDNGSTAVEVALKVAFQYWRHKGVEGRESFLSLRQGYHGDTLGAVSVGGIDVFHAAFGPLLFKSHLAPAPYCYRCELGHPGPEHCALACLGGAEAILREKGHEIAAVIMEPMLQGAGGIIVSPPGYLKGMRELCDRYNVLLIADEVATGFGRTGKMFACGHEGVTPDIICLAKGITGGYLPLAATVFKEEIYEAFLGAPEEMKTFFHGHSYTGNPLAAAVALANIKLLRQDPGLKALQPKADLLNQWLKDISTEPHVGEARGLGLFAGVELVKDKHSREPFDATKRLGARACLEAREGGVLIRPLGDVVVIAPPLAIEEGDLAHMLDVITRAIARATAS